MGFKRLFPGMDKIPKVFGEIFSSPNSKKAVDAEMGGTLSSGQNFFQRQLDKIDGGSELIDSREKAQRLMYTKMASGYSEEAAAQSAKDASMMGQGLGLDGSKLEGGPVAERLSILDRMNWHYMTDKGWNDNQMMKDAAKGGAIAGGVGAATYGAVNYFGDDD